MSQNSERLSWTFEEFDAKLAEHMGALHELFSEGDRLQGEIEAQLQKLRFDATLGKDGE